MPTEHHPLSGVIIEQHTLTLSDFCQALHVRKEVIIELVDYQVLEPTGNTPEEWHFDSTALRRGRLAASFLYDLEINLPGIALALELLDKIEQLQQRV